MKTDRIVSLSAMLVGIGSLVIVVYQTQLMRASQAAAALPYLMVALMDNDEGTYVVVRNAGVGPALLEDVRIRHRGRELETDPHDFFVAERGAVLEERFAEQIQQGEFSGGLNVDRLLPGRLIPAGDWVLTLGWVGDGADEVLTELLGLFDIAEVPQNWYDAAGVPASGPEKAVIDITYASVYGDRWRVTSDKIAPERLD